MLRSLNSAVSGVQQFQQQMDVIGNNVANVNTTGYKAARTDLADTFSNTLKLASGGQAAIQIGTGVTTTATKTNFTQGAITRTGVQTDLSVSGEGFFMVRDSINDRQYATRSGDFRLDSTGILITNTGFRVQGYTDSSLATIGDLQIDGTQRPVTADPTATLTSYSINQDGKVMVRLSDGSEYVRGQVLLQNYNDQQALVKEGSGLYSGLASAGPIAAAPSAPGTNGLGKVESGALELSNVDLASEFSNLIVTQRAFQANSRVITTSDEMMQELVNLKR